MSLTPSTVIDSETAFDSDVECGADDDVTSVEAQFGDGSSCSSVSVENVGGLEECDEVDAGTAAGRQHERDGCRESVNNVGRSQLMTTASDCGVSCTPPMSVDWLTTVQLRDTQCDYEKSAWVVTDINSSPLTELAPPESVLRAEKLWNKNMNQVTVRRASMERTALWCADVTDCHTGVGKATTSFSDCDRCLAADHTGVSNADCLPVNTHSDVERLTAVTEPDSVSQIQCDDGSDERPARVLELCQLADGHSSSRVKQSDMRLCDSGERVVPAASDTDLLAGGAAGTNDQLLELVQSSAVNLPLVEDGLSSGHVTDADDDDDTTRPSSSTLCPTNKSVETSSEEHRELPVEQWMSEIQSTVKHIRDTSSTVSRPACDDVMDYSDNTDVDDQAGMTCCDGHQRQTVWITRGRWLADAVTETLSNTNTNCSTHPSSRTLAAAAGAGDDDEEDDEEIVDETRGPLLKVTPSDLAGAEDAETDEETDKLLARHNTSLHTQPADSPVTGKIVQERLRRTREVALRDPDNKQVLIEGILFRASYLGSTQLTAERGQTSKSVRMMQAQEAVGRIKAPAGEPQPSTEVDLFVSTDKFMVLDTSLQEVMMDHGLRTISFIADISDVLVVMVRRCPPVTSDTFTRQTPTKICCHVFETDDAELVAQSIGRAFHVAYMEFLKANGVDCVPSQQHPSVDYQEVLSQQEVFGDELSLFANKDLQKEIIVTKLRGESLGVVVVESGWGSMVPTVVLANMHASGPAARSNQLNIGDQIMAINGISLVGLPLSSCQKHIKAARSQTVVKLSVVSCPPVVEVVIRRPHVKYSLGFSVQKGVICSLLRGGIAERGGVRVGHRIIEINGISVVAVSHDRIVNLLMTSVGQIRMKTMPTSIFRLLTGQDVPHYI